MAILFLLSGLYRVEDPVGGEFHPVSEQEPGERVSSDGLSRLVL